MRQARNARPPSICERSRAAGRAESSDRLRRPQGAYRGDPAVTQLALDSMGSLRRTHATREVTTALVGREVVLAGWIQRRRDHGGVVFVDLRDRDGLVQVVFKPDSAPECHERAGQLRSEYVVCGARARRAPLARDGEPEARHRRGRGDRRRAAAAEPRDAPALRDRGGGRRRRGHAAALPHPRPAPPAAPARAAAAPRAGARRAQSALRPRLPRDRDADAGEAPRPRARATSWCPRGSSPASSTRCPSRRRS